jgi:hypothetical protein
MWSICYRFAALFCAELAQKRVKKNSIFEFLKMLNSREMTFSKDWHLEETFG